MLKVTVYDERLRELIDFNQELTHLGNLCGFFEGPIWSEKKQELTMSGLTNQTTWRWSKKDGLRKMRSNTNIGNGMAFDSEGRILVCEQLGRRVARMSYDMTDYQVIATTYNGQPLNSPNDIIVHSNGMIYFSDPNFGHRPSRHGRFGPMMQPVQGIYSIHPDTLELTLVTDEPNNPNGLCFSPDEKTMYFAETGMGRISAMDFTPEGRLVNRRTIGYSENLPQGRPDGIKCDVQGNLWVTAAGGTQIFEPKGTLLGIVHVPEICGNAAFGGEGWTTFFMGSEADCYTIKTKVPGQKLRY